MQKVTDYLFHLWNEGRIIGGRMICSIFRNSENPSINTFGDTGKYKIKNE